MRRWVNFVALSLVVSLPSASFARQHPAASLVIVKHPFIPADPDLVQLVEKTAGLRGVMS